MLVSSKIQSSSYERVHNQRALTFNYSQNILKNKGIIPYEKDYDKEILKTIKDHRLFHYILNDIQKEEDMSAYLITLTNTSNMKNVSKFISKLGELKRKKAFNQLEYYYYATIEPTKRGNAHIHIKLMFNKIKGAATEIRRIVSTIGYGLKHIKKQKNVEPEKVNRDNYLLKTLHNNHYKEYNGWIDGINISMAKAVSRSRYIKINEDISITLNDFKMVRKVLTKRNVTIADVKAYIFALLPLYKPAYKVLFGQKKNKPTFKNVFTYLQSPYNINLLIRILKEASPKENVVQLKHKIPETSYSNTNQVIVLKLFLFLLKEDNKGPPKRSSVQSLWKTT